MFSQYLQTFWFSTRNIFQGYVQEYKIPWSVLVVLGAETIMWDQALEKKITSFQILSLCWRHQELQPLILQGASIYPSSSNKKYYFSDFSSICEWRGQCRRNSSKTALKTRCRFTIMCSGRKRHSTLPTLIPSSK